MRVPLLQPDELAWLLQLSLRTATWSRHTREGARRSLYSRGYEPEVVRRYQYGDDVRRIDWAATLRMQRPMVRQTVATSHAEVRMFLDTSPSMTMDDEVWYQCRRLCAALGVVAIASGDTVQGIAGHDYSQGFLVLQRWLEWCETTLPQTTPWTMPLALQRSQMAFCISDLLQTDWEPQLRRFAQYVQDPVLCHVQSDDLVRLVDQDEYQLVDSETNAVVRVTIDDGTRQRYQDIRARWYVQVAETCQQLGIHYVAFTPHTSLLTVVSEVVQ